MVTVDILKRKDAASLVVGIIAAFIIVQAISVLSNVLLDRVGFLREGYGGSPGSGIGQFLRPIVDALFGLILLEVAAWIYIFVASQFTSNKK